MLAYRVENEKGLGPFRCDEWDGQADLIREIIGESYPSPYNDGIHKLKGQHPGTVYYGAPSVRKLRQWFPLYLDLHLHEAGFLVSCYNLGPANNDGVECWKMGVSGTQIAFVKESAKLKWRQKISEVFA
jgi:hypothetical protein